MKKFLIIDSHALIHRAFHALPPSLTTKAGDPTNAIYGFFSIFLKALKEIKPDYVAAAFDLPEKTIRHEEFEEYKAHRPKAPNELISQIKAIKEILAGINIGIFEKPKYEADDVIGSLAEKIKKTFEGDIIILTGDLDTLQLINDKVSILTLKKGISETFVYDAKEVFLRWGLTPEQMTDFKALKGDPSDNIPGVSGVGEKTAVALIKEFKTLENLYVAVKKDKNNIKENIKLKLQKGEEQAFFSKKLSEIKTDLNIDLNIDSCNLKNINVPELKKYFGKYEFFSLIKRINEALYEEKKNDILEKANISGQEKQRHINIDDVVEAAEKGKKTGIFLDGSGNIFLAGGGGVFLGSAREILSSDSVKKILKNDEIKKISFDSKQLFKNFSKKEVRDYDFGLDLKLAFYLLKPGEKEYSFEGLLDQETGKAPENFGAEDFFLLAEKIEGKIKKNNLEKVLYNIEQPLAKILSLAEMEGIELKKEHLRNLDVKIKKNLKDAEEKIYKISQEPFNINSPQQVADILFNKLKIESKGMRKTGGGKISTKFSEMEKLAKKHEIARLIIEYRESAKLKTTYVDALPKLVGKDGRIHTTFNQCGTATGRLSSLEPNLQNIPVKSDLGNEIRVAFASKKGFSFLSFDYSQIELRIVASLSSDEKMIRAFLDGDDIHKITAAKVNDVPPEEVTDEMRQHAKALNFGIIYGMGSKAFAESAGIDIKEANEFIKKYFIQFEKVAEYIEDVKKTALKKGYVETLFGRKRYLSAIASSNWQDRHAAERMAINMPVQGSAADIIKMAMISSDVAIGRYCDASGLKRDDNINLLLQIHDELVYEARDGITEAISAIIKKQMESVVRLQVPLKVNLKKGKNLGFLK